MKMLTNILSIFCPYLLDDQTEGSLEIVDRKVFLWWHFLKLKRDGSGNQSWMFLYSSDCLHGSDEMVVKDLFPGCIISVTCDSQGEAVALEHVPIIYPKRKVDVF